MRNPTHRNFHRGGGGGDDGLLWGGQIATLHGELSSIICGQCIKKKKLSSFFSSDVAFFPVRFLPALHRVTAIFSFFLLLWSGSLS
jgi:hypothetical protein